MEGRVTALATVLVVLTAALTVGAAAQTAADAAGSDGQVGAVVATPGDSPDPGDAGGNTSERDRQADAAGEGEISRPATGTQSGVPHSVTRPFDPTPTLEQPDGVTFEAQFWSAGPTGGWRTSNGYTVLSGEDGYWYYATRAEGRLVPGDARVGIDRVPASVPTGLAPSVETETTAIGVDEVPPTGTQEIPVVAINFSDTSKSYSPSDFQSLLFGDDPDIATGPGSVTDYYEENSGGQLTLTGDVSGWETADNGESYYGDGGIGDGGSPTGAAELVKEAAQKADDQVDFAQYDNDNDCLVDQFATIHQGGGQEVTQQTEDIWSHRWSLASGTGSAYATDDSSPECGTIYVNGYTIQPETYGGQIATIGVYAHEFGHGLGLPDLYDTDGSSAGIGNWGLMGSGSYGSVVRSGDAPNHMTAWTKASLGWLDPLTVTTGESQDDISLSNVSKSNDSLKLLDESNNTNGEYFYVANRQQVGFDQGLPGEGLLVTHINESRLADDCVFSNDCNDDENNKLVDIEAADGNGELDDNTNRGDAGDLWDGETGPFDDGSTPSSDYDDGSSSNAAVSAIGFSAGPAQGAATFDAAAGTPAEFTVSSLQPVDATVTNGTELDVSADIENVGGLESTQNITLTVGGLSRSRSQTLAAGASTTVTFSGIDTGVLGPGNYTHEVASANDSAGGSLVVESATPATFAVTLTDTSAPVTAGETLSVGATVENTGDLDGTQTVSLDGGALGTNTTTVSLAGNASTDLTLALDTAPGDDGSYSVLVSTENDTANQSITVEAPATPALSGLDVAGQGTNATIPEGDNRSVSVSVENVGDQTGSFEVALALGSSVATTQSTGELAGGATETLTFESVTGGLTDGAYTVNVSVGDALTSGALTVEEQVGLVFSTQNVTEQETVSVESVSSVDEVLLLVTYEEDGEDIVAGVTNGTFDGGNVTIGLGSFIGFPAEYTAHLVPAANVSGNYTPGDTLSANTTEEVLANATATVTTFNGAPEVVVGEDPAKDTDADGLLEDVNGSGAFNIFDVQALFVNRQGSGEDLSNASEYFNFQGELPDEVTIFDVQALFTDLSE